MLKLIRNKWESLDEKQRQLGRALLVISAVFAMSFVISYFRNDHKKLYDKKESKIDFSDVLGKGSLKDTWLEHSETKLEDLEKQLAEEKRDKEELRKQLENLTTEVQDANKNNQQQFQLQLEQLRKENNNKPNNTKPESIKSRDNQRVSNDPFSRVSEDFNDFTDANNGEQSDQSFNDNRQIDLVNFSNIEERNSFALDNYLPAGSYVKAVLISSVDASAGVTSQSDPRPVLFRIIGEARSAVDKDHYLAINIKGCTVTGAAHGDLSSERAYARLLKMTCSDSNGGVIETDVEGYASDAADGKNGIAGIKVSRVGDLVAQSFFASFISGFGGGYAQKFTPPLTASNGLTTQGVLSSGDILKSGLGKGVSGGADRIAEFAMGQAEQIQPVISIASGKEVELVFQSGTYLDGRKSSPKSQTESSKSQSSNKL